MGGSMGTVPGATGSFLIAFPALFSIVNPPGGALIYHQVTADRGHAERVRLAWRGALYPAAGMVVALWAGASLIGFFGVTLPALRITGGLVVAARAWELLSAPQQQEDRKQAQAAPAAAAGRGGRRRLLPAHHAVHGGSGHHRGGDRARRQPADRRARPPAVLRRELA